MKPPPQYSYMSDEDWELFYSDCLSSHGVTPQTLDKILDLIEEDMRTRGVSEEEHQVGKNKV